MADMPDDHSYCVAAVGHDGEAKVHLNSFDDVSIYLREKRTEWANEYAEFRIANPGYEDHFLVGGPGVWLRNRWLHEVEVGVGLDFWFVFAIKPKPSRMLRTATIAPDTLIFYLDGGHYTEIEPSWQVPKNEALAFVRDWLDTGALPPPLKK